MNKPGILLEVVQILSDLDFIITKAYVSSDGGWFMDGRIMIYTRCVRFMLGDRALFLYYGGPFNCKAERSFILFFTVKQINYG